MLKKARKLIIPAALYTAALLSPTGILALVPSGELVPKDIRPINNIVSVIRTIIQFILVVAFVLAFVMLLIGGIRWITAGGDEKAVGSARNMITAALIGLVIVLVAYALIKLVETFFGINIISGGVNIPQITDAP
ncbi:hypothetical protein A2870_01890 [Candidatus Curtissbacteria bacterium RIFCSPHIGHO2_01_FULL_41_11]|uniref:Uncharacterized protein n=1 Tax=Candidatus Curtissbacteria bacterium RIFCSPHIGHO2_01_FULL_41_11 TaxID=1797711 RepID=A0A1F5G3T8_9BACT|nr:MAG: hypothetical protein A2870_01890 [Candidatus Curtissbacteria bacterium RIFCSPHIGHO2_01_FULL_41_11]